MSSESQFSSGAACLSEAIGALFPPGVIAADMQDPGDPASLSPAERDIVKRAVAKRIQEFAAGRSCARRALDEFGIHGFELLSAPDRQPLWPASMVGSITHTAGYCVAVVAARSQLSGLGVDSEQVEAVGEELWPTICGPAESAWRDSLSAECRTAAVALLFCAKEAFYKCQYPLTEEWLDFHDLQIETHAWGQANGDFTVHATRDLKVAQCFQGVVQGRYRFHDGLVTAGIALERQQPGQ